jgi:hypothetical protein
MHTSALCQIALCQVLPIILYHVPQQPQLNSPCQQRSAAAAPPAKPLCKLLLMRAAACCENKPDAART